MARLDLSNGVYLGYDHDANALRFNESQKYEVWFDKPAKFGNLFEESVASARRIRESTDKEIVVMYSGGLDSEWTLESFRLAGIPVTALCVAYKNGLNEHDVFWAKRYIERASLQSVIWHELDLEDWYKSDEQKHIALVTQTPELAYTAQFKAILDNKTSDRVFITSYDEPLLVGTDTTSPRSWSVTYSERHYSVVKLFNEFEVDGCSNWSRQSAELFAAYVTQPQWKMLWANLHAPMSWNSELVKIPMYQSWFPFMEGRPKYTGFEGGLSFVVEGGKAWRRHIKEKFDATWMADYVEPIESVWGKLGVANRVKATTEV